MPVIHLESVSWNPFPRLGCCTCACGAPCRFPLGSRNGNAHRGESMDVMRPLRSEAPRETCARQGRPSSVPAVHRPCSVSSFHTTTPRAPTTGPHVSSDDDSRPAPGLRHANTSHLPRTSHGEGTGGRHRPQYLGPGFGGRRTRLCMERRWSPANRTLEVRPMGRMLKACGARATEAQAILPDDRSSGPATWCRLHETCGSALWFAQSGGQSVTWPNG